VSGIAGLFYLDGREVSPIDIDGMTETLAQRGPDDRGAWAEGPVGFGHRALWTTPESLQEKLPFLSADGILVITADARLDNRDELISRIGISNRDKSSISDSELIVAAYQKWGEECPQYFLGDFVFAIWDIEKQNIFIARDHFGVRPIYYHHRQKIFAFASEIKGLLALDDIPRKLNEVRVADFLVPLFDDKEITFYEDIYRLPPASSLVISRDKFRIWSYWSLDHVSETQLGSDDDYKEAFLELFSEAVQCRLRSAYPVGSMLSGGLDSSSIATVARNYLAQNERLPLHTFSAIFDTVTECDERAYIHPILEQGGFEPHFLHADQISPLTDVERILWTQDAAFFSPNRFMHWGMYKLANQQQVRVLLDGIDGDTTISHGLTRLIELALSFQWGTLNNEVKAISKRSGQSKWFVWRVGVLKPLIPKNIYDRWRTIRGKPVSFGISNPTINPEFAQRVNLDGRFEIQRQDWLKLDRKERDVHQRQLEWGLATFFLEGLNKAASALSVEPRYPFFDKRLVELCLSLPSAYKLHRGWTRWILRSSMQDILPAKVQWRKRKTSLGPNFTRGFLKYDKPQIDKLITEDDSKLDVYLDRKALQASYQRYLNSKSKDDEMFVWTAVALGIWLNHSRFK
jgi:asparagine synthase (glutamine-hydrolysing)